MGHLKVMMIGGFLALTQSAFAFAAPGGDDELVASENPLNDVCSISVSHDCEMVTGPTPEAPRLTELGDAECSVSYRVNDDGSVTVISAKCDDERFVDSAVTGMSSVRYKTRDVCGRVCRNVGREFDVPIYFNLDE